MKLVKSSDSYHYICVSLIIWRINGLSRIQNIDKDASIKIVEILNDKLHDRLPFILDFKRVVSFTDGVLNELFKYITFNKQEIYFVNYKPILSSLLYLFSEFKGHNAKQKEEGNYLIIYFNDIPTLNTNLSNLMIGINLSIDEEIKRYVKATYTPNGIEEIKFVPLRSTPILATGKFDASKIIAQPDQFSWICIRLTDEVEKLISQNNLLNVNILSVSLRASPFASAISLMLRLPMKTIDHLGPIQKVWDMRPFSKFEKIENNNIFIADFIVGGTELKLAHLFSKYCHSNLQYAVSLGHVIPTDHFIDYKVISLVNIIDLNVCEYKIF